MEVDADYQNVDRALSALDSDLDAAECHGMLCGMLCNPETFDAQLWLRQVVGEDAPPVSTGGEAGVLWALLRQTRSAIVDEELSFRLLLVDDNRQFTRRVRSVANWCRGFLVGFGIAGVVDISVLSEDCRGFLSDLKQISQADEKSALDEDNERAFEEIVEYVRIGVLMLREETRFDDSGASDEPAPTLH
ncbi:MAG: UPF0149 family protein [Gammaproteobacteria bacterium]|nr:UPF0149 family protein [Gammaproteobacteria bacterium]